MQEMLSITDNAYAVHTMNLNSTKLHSLSNNKDSTNEYVEQVLANKRADHTKLTFNLMLEVSEMTFYCLFVFIKKGSL